MDVVTGQLGAQGLQPNIKFDKNVGRGAGKAYNVVLQLSIVVFTGALVWFSFVYYPKVVDNYKNIPLPVNKSLARVSADFSGFPIESEAFRITYESGANSYYIFVEGKNLAEYVEYKNSAVLALKTALSVDSLCNFNVIYVSTKQLTVPDNLKITPNCN